MSFKLNKKRAYWRVNINIRAPEVRVINEKGEQIGVMSTTEALGLAGQEEKDLVEIAPLAKPPVVKIIEFGKFRYQEGKKAQKEKTKTKQVDIKEVRFSPFIGEADYNTRLAKVKGFLDEGHKIRAVVKFKGREMGSKKFGYSLFERLIEGVGREVNIDMKPKFLGRHLTMVISPLKGK